MVHFATGVQVLARYPDAARALDDPIGVSLTAHSQGRLLGRGAHLPRRWSLSRHWQSRACHLAPQEVVVPIEELAGIEGLVLLHFLFHQVLHDARVEVVAGLLVGHVVFLRVVKQRLAALVLVHGRGPLGSRCALAVHLLRVALLVDQVRLVARLVAADRCVVLRVRRSGQARHWRLVHQDHLR